MNRAFSFPPRRVSLLEPEGVSARPELHLACASGGGGGGQQPDLYKEYYGELLAKSQMAPTVFGTEAEFDPAYAGLNMNTLNDTLFGLNNYQVNTPAFAQGVNPSYANFPNVGQPLTTTATSPGISSAPNYAGPGTGTAQDLQAQFNNINAYRNSRTGRTNRGVVNLPGNYTPVAAPMPSGPAVRPQSISSPGLLDIINRSAAPLAQAQATSTSVTRGANVADLMRLGPQAVAAANAADPENAKLLASMTSDAQRGLDLGTNMDPAQSRQALQMTLNSRNGMLGGTGTAGDFSTALGLSSFGQQLKQMRQQYAGNVFNQRGTYYGNAINNIMNGGSVVNPLSGVGSMFTMGQGGPRLFGSDINAQQTYSDALNASNAKSIASANNSAAMTSAGISAGVGLAGMAALALL